MKWSDPLDPQRDRSTDSTVLRSRGTERRERRALNLDPQARPYLIPSLIPQELKDRRTWLFWHAEQTLENRKAPHAYNARTGEFYRVDNQDPRHWMPYEDAAEIAQRHGMGLGSVLNGDGVVVMDIDAGLPPQSYVPDGSEESDLLRASWERQMIEVAMYMGTFAERSASGRGLHIWGTGTLPFDGRNVRPCEIYASGRFMIVTGRWLQSTPMALRPIEHHRVANIVRRFFAQPGRRISPEATRALGTITHQDVGQMELDELELLASRHREEALFRSVAMQPGGWRNAEAFGKNFPSQSEADFWFMNELAWLTRGEADRMERLFRSSALMRSKFNERRGALSYGHKLIEHAISSYHARRQEWLASREQTE